MAAGVGGSEDSDDLIYLAQSLPRELYDEVFRLTFTTPTNTPIVIGRGYTPPSTLSVNHTTRVKALQSYYSVSIFHFSDRSSLLQWLLSLQRAQRQQICRIDWDWFLRRDMDHEVVDQISRFFESEAESLFRVLLDLRIGNTVVNSIHIPQYCETHECWELVRLREAMGWKLHLGKS